MFFDGVYSSYSKCSKILNTFLSFLIKKFFSHKKVGYKSEMLFRKANRGDTDQTASEEEV